VNGRPLRTGLALAVVCAAAVVAYAPSFAVPFQFDDYARLGGNRALREGNTLPALLWLGNSRLVPSTTLLLNYRIGGLDPLGYHVVNFAVHMLASVGVFALALTLCRTPRLRDAWPATRALPLATAAAVVFACHPLQTQAVTYIIQRYSSMAALFYVWAVVCYMRARIRQTTPDGGRAAPYFAATIVLSVCAVLSKENTASLPVALLLGEWVGFGWPRRWRVIGIGALLALVVVAIPVIWKTAYWIPYNPAWLPSFTPLYQRVIDAILAPRASPVFGTRPTSIEYFLTEATVVPRYLRLAVLPWGLNVDHDVPIAHGLSVPVAAGLAALAGLLALGVSQVRRRPLVAFAILWVFVTLSVESSLFAIDDVMVEHRMYLPMAGVALGAGWFFVVARERAPRVARSAAVAVALGLVALTFARNVVWMSPLTLWVDAAGKSPEKARPQLNAGVAYHQVDRLDEAVEHYCRALKLDPDSQLTRDNLEIALEALGRLDAIEAKPSAVAADGTVTIELDDLTSFCP
jgi:protein O-mannosyl-transferase